MVLLERFMSVCLIGVARNGRPGMTVQMAEAELRYLCVKSRQIFLEQPTLLELEAPIKICGRPNDRQLFDIYLIR